MAKVILAFVILSVAIGGAIELFRSLSGRDKWQLTKTISYAIMCSVLALAVLTTIVILF